MSKTKIMRGYQCLKNLYLTIHHPELETPITPEQQAKFDQGADVGVEARKTFPEGVLVDNLPWDFIGSLKKTRELLSLQTETIFEAAFEYKGLYARADIIRFSKETGRWSIYEVKSSLKVKPEQIDDITLQAWIMANCGLPIEKISILHLNPECEFPNLEKLFVEVDVTEKARKNYNLVSPKLNQIFSSLKEKTPPSTEIGPHCTEPYECNFKNHCFKEKNIPEMSIFNMPQMRDRLWDLYRSGIVNVDDSRLTHLSPLQERMVEVFKSGKRYVNASGIQEAMKSWEKPYVFLDFETINPALPRYKGVRPYMQTPFQFSVHVCKDLESELEHFEFLHSDLSDPRDPLIESLLQACGQKGSIIAYFGQFESDRILELAEYSQEHAPALMALKNRIVDPLPILREHVYDNAFMGSFSLKKVGPALLGEVFSYKGMLVSDGGACQRAFEEMVDPETSEHRKQELRKAILEYCKKDTYVMVELIKWMNEISSATASSSSS